MDKQEIKDYILNNKGHYSRANIVKALVNSGASRTEVEGIYDEIEIKLGERVGSRKKSRSSSSEIPPPPSEGNSDDVLGIIALVLVLLGIFFIPVITTIAGIIIAHVDRGKRKTGINLAALIIGYISLVLFVLFILFLVGMFVYLADSYEPYDYDSYDYMDYSSGLKYVNVYYVLDVDENSTYAYSDFYEVESMRNKIVMPFIITEPRAVNFSPVDSAMTFSSKKCYAYSIENFNTGESVGCEVGEEYCLGLNDSINFFENDRGQISFVCDNSEFGGEFKTKKLYVDETNYGSLSMEYRFLNSTSDYKYSIFGMVSLPVEE